ncbi:AAA family ATPase [Streptosporangium sp. NBC_01639]|uniref:AAA family ATPase n=1 Tax=Streptosporangium sp. NBC_01639 TaxID=2975948 RepID=UPI00386EC7F2|nr:AAA family ATPase [Streptosporangium sp. NBC_01639]
MRPHRLWISAFGSFPGDEEVDFDALAEAGLFLIHGPTGAGKTTVLDALCYALYGRVPGKRDSAKSLRCDHAPPGRGPSVALEVTVRGRRLKISRSPAWQRPKLRGTGTTRENEKALLQELTPSGEWRGLTTRVDEAGELIGTLLGMNADQFFQVAMLPQGDFARFLRADGEDRRKVLERLFSVRVYAAAESWLADRRTEAHREQQALRKEVDFAVKRLEEAAGPDLPAALAAGGSPEFPGSAETTPAAPAAAAPGSAETDTTPAAPVAAPGSAETGPVELFDLPGDDAEPPAAVSAEDDPLEWARALEELAARALSAMSRDHGEGESAVWRARTMLEDGAALAERRRRHAEALARSRVLEESAEERADLEVILAEAARADRVLPLIQGAEQRAEAAAKAHRLAADALARALPLRGGDQDADPDRLALLERDRQREITRLGELREEESRLVRIVQDREKSGREITELTAAQAETDARLALLPGLRHDVDTRLTAARLDAARIPAAESAEQAAVARLRSAGHRDDLAAELAAARADLAVRLSALAVRDALPAGLPAPAVHDVPAAGVRDGFPSRSSAPAVHDVPATGARDDLPAGSPAPTADDDPPAAPSAGLARDGAPPAPDGAEVRELLAVHERARSEELAGLEGLRADETRLAELAGLLAALDAELRDAAAQESALGAAQEELPVALAEASARLAVVREQAARIPAARAATETAAARRDAARRRDGLHRELETARTAQTEATDHAQRLRDRHLDLRQARIDGMAAELARKLAPGAPCVVCGSPDHPAPAAPADEAPTAEDERAAQSAYDAADDRRRAAEHTVAALTSRLEEAAAVAGELAADQAEEILAEAGRELAALTAAADREAALSAETDRVAAELDDTRSRAAETARLLAEGRARQVGWQAERDRLTGRLDEARGADPTVQVRRDRLTEDVVLLGAALIAASHAAGLATAHRDAAEQTDLTVEDAEQGFREAEQALARLRESAGTEPALTAEAGRIAGEITELQERSRELAVTLAARRTDVRKLTAEAERLTARIDEARGEDPTLAVRLDRLSDEAELLREAVEATREELVTAGELATARARAQAAVVEAGFLGLDDARAAVRPPAEQGEKATRLRELDKERAAVTAVLTDPELIAAVAEPEPDLDGLRRARDAADAAHAGLLSARHQAETRQARLAALRAELEECLERWLPAAERHRLADRLAALTGGNSSDNQWNMRLSSYVLGERLRQVVESANERLDHMSGGRYLLEHNLGRSAGDRSRSGGGLGLRILDGWTGADRDPATLSGGESFITSLALALGLADVVTAEAGGVELGTLFVDEGFGTLDEDTLDGVLDILDGLRDGGRAVGIVSHVAELRTRVPAQLRVRKDRHGSTLSVVA